MNATRERGIKILETASQIKLSPEQLRIVDHKFTRPTLVNACAGSGKTTMLLFKVMLDILLGDYVPTQITCLTFTRRACKSMDDRYQEILARLQKMGHAQNFVGKPTFKTFDSWFLFLLKQAEPVNVIPGPNEWLSTLMHSLVAESAVEDKRTQIANIFACYDYLINKRLTKNGLYTGGHKQAFARFQRTQLSEYQRGDPKFTENYESVVKAYNRMKAEYSRTDFNDIKVKLEAALQIPDKRRKILAQSYLVGELFIDEFQDTNDVQWQLINELLLPETRQHISVIGDDDQAIYAFRGSNPGLILNFSHMFPNAQVFNLSTNYRTAGNILSAAKTSIKKNHWRLPKELLSSTPGKGNVLYFTERSSQGLFGDVQAKTDGKPKQKMFRYLKYLLKSPKYKGQTIAILVRTNAYKSMIADQLASIGYFVNPARNTDILQNRPIYKSCFHLMSAFTFNNFWDYADEARRLGFSSYKRHIWTVINEHHQRPIRTYHLSTYLSLAKIRDRVLRKDSRRNPDYTTVNHENLAIQLDNKAAFILKYVQHTLKEHADGPKLLGKLGLAINDITSKYYHYMFKRHFVSVNLTRQGLTYFSQLTHYYNSLAGFFAGERYKRLALTQNLKDHNLAPGSGRVQVMTIHQAKGLQFDQVCLVGISTNEIQPADVQFNKYFAPNLNPAQFLKRLLTMHASTLGYLDSQLTEGQLKQIGTTGKDLRHELLDLGYYYCQAHHLDRNYLSTDGIIKHLADGSLTNPDVIGKLQKSLRILYNLIRDKSYSVEQERHLLYVGATRAKKGLCFDSDTDNSPLMDELDNRYIKYIFC